MSIRLVGGSPDPNSGLLERESDPSHRHSLSAQTRPRPQHTADIGGVLTYALGVTALILGALVYRHFVVRRNAYLIALALGCLIAGGAVEYRWRVMESRFTAAVRESTGRDDVNVHCQRFTAAFLDPHNRAGHVEFTPDGSLPTQANLTWETCRHLRAWASGAKVASGDLDGIIGLHVLAHETEHLMGETDEARTECIAIQRDRDLAVAFGATVEAGTAVALRYWQEVYPRMREDYRSDECRNGGDLDRHPDSSQWPSG